MPPPVPQMHEALAAWDAFLGERRGLPPLVQCALMHERFEAIHPFMEGNGRLGRLLITLFLIDRGRLAHPLLYPSAYIEAHRAQYYDLLQAVRTAGAWEPWLLFFCDAVRETAERASPRRARSWPCASSTGGRCPGTRASWWTTSSAPRSSRCPRRSRRSA